MSLAPVPFSSEGYVASRPFVFGAWACTPQPASSASNPDQLQQTNPRWLPAVVPGTVAAVLQSNGAWKIGQPLDIDGEDWWYRTEFAGPSEIPQQPVRLCFDGLATIAEVWLNGVHLLAADNMFRIYQVDIASCLKARNELVIVFRSMAKALEAKRSRPRWKTKLVHHQQLRWHRTTLLGRVPGWSPPIIPIGPWRPVRIDFQPLVVEEFRLLCASDDGTDVITLDARIRSTAAPESVRLRLGDNDFPVACGVESEGWRLRATVRIQDLPRWWPHTHGDPNLVACELHIQAGPEGYTIPCGKVGLRTIRVCRGTNRLSKGGESQRSSEDGGFSLEVNGVPVYCRGACWTIGDIVSLDASPEVLARDLRLARAAGVNMLRVGGTMIYESETFYRLCDELGILVWQDFMFANMDYPYDDPDFAQNVEAEAKAQLKRLCVHPCIAVYCGNSEVEQQAAMLGMPREVWRNRWFAERLPALCAEIHPGVPYVPSTPSGGVMPFHVRTGLTHYYGVGAYLRSPQEVRRANVQFSPECLAFANVPEPETIDAMGHGNTLAFHNPRWKERVPRDTGAGWDFEDVRDFYLRHFFGVDPVQLRSFDPARYQELSRPVSGEMMAQVFAEWRSGHSHNGGGLVWFFKDLWPGASWGIVDSQGLPKAPYYYLRRAWQTRQITVTDEGLDGLHLHVINESATPLTGFVELVLLKDQQVIIARGEAPVDLPPRDQRALGSDEILGGFYDVCYAYRFGPPKHDVAIATLYDAQHQVLSEAFHFVQQREPAFLSAFTLEAEAEPAADGAYHVNLRCNRFLQCVRLDAQDFLPDDNYFHLVPSRQKTLCLTPRNDRKPRFSAMVEALNLKDPVKIVLKQPAR